MEIGIREVTPDQNSTMLHGRNEQIVDIQLHGFSDSSEKAYGSAVYLRLKDEDGRIRLHLAMSKTRLAPIKKKTLPQLELCGALVLARPLSSSVPHPRSL